MENYVCKSTVNKKEFIFNRNCFIHLKFTLDNFQFNFYNINWDIVQNLNDFSKKMQYW